MKKKILYIGGFKLPDRNAAAQRVLGNARALQELGYEVVFLGTTENKVRDSFFSKGFRSRELKYPSNTIEWFNNITSIKSVKQVIEEEKPNTLIVYNYPGIQMYKLRKLCYKKQIKLIADVTELYTPEWFSIFSAVKRFDVWLRMKHLHFKLDGLIVISSLLESYYRSKIDKLIKVPPLVSDDYISIKTIGKDNNRIELVYSGSPGNGGKDKLDLIIKSFTNVKNNTKINCQLNIVGVTKEDFLKHFEISNPSLENVIFWGRVTHETALNIVQKSHFSVFFRDPNLVNNAGFPTKFVESISSGTPVITNATSDLPDYFKKYSKKIGFLVEDLKSSDSIHQAFFDAFQTIKDGTYQDMSLFCKKSNLFNYINYVEEFKKIF